MNEAEYLLLKLAEECMKVGQRVTKALTFGLNEVQEGQPFDNLERVAQEFDDLLAVAGRLRGLGSLRDPDIDAQAEKVAKLRKFMNYSRSLGIIRP